MPDVPRPTPVQSANAFRERHGLGDAPIRDIIQVAEDFSGAQVMTLPFPQGYDAFTMQHAESGLTIIAVGTTDNYERQRFSVAHEIGHLESGALSPDVHSHPDYTRSPDEVWADEFARHLLIPAGAIDRYFTDAGAVRGSLSIEGLSDLVRIFAVSPMVGLIQLRDTRWISQAEFDAWSNAQPAWTGRRLAVTFGWGSEREAMVRGSQTPRRPTHVVRAATTAYADGRSSLESLAQISGERDLAALQVDLEEAGIRPAPRVETGDVADDFSDLFGPDE